MLRDYVPALKYGHKISPSDIAGMIGLPYVGEIIYIDPTNGNDTSGNGKTQNNAYKTLTQAESVMTAYSHDIAVIVSGGTAGTAEVANITWDKDYCHVIGSAAPTNVSQRARIVFTVDETDPCLTLSANGCIFSNVQVATWQDSNDVLAQISGDRNYFSNVHFAGMGTATAGDDATGRSLYLNDADENYFDHCMIGLDTIMRSAANAEIEFAGGCQRNTFSDCMIIKAADSVDSTFVLSTGTSGLDRWQRFHNCTWYSFWTNNADQITAAFNVSAQTATAGGPATGAETQGRALAQRQPPARAGRPAAGGGSGSGRVA